VADTNLVRLLPVGDPEPSLLSYLCATIPRYLPVRCEISSTRLDAATFYHPERQQYHSSEILQAMQQLLQARDWRLLAVTGVDLYIPILKYVFGEAQMGGQCAVVSCFRLRQEFYGLDPDIPLLEERLLKESIHELGHTFQLAHCDDYRCTMASAHAVEWIDLREDRLCQSCEARLGWRRSTSLWDELSSRLRSYRDNG
jgi:archaemetzincin